MNKVSDLKDLYQLMPGWVHIHRAKDLSLLSMNAQMQEDLCIPDDEMPHLRRNFLERYLQKKSYRKVEEVLQNLSGDGIYEKVVSYFSNYLYNDDFYRWYFTSSRYNRADGIILSLTFPVEKLFYNPEILVNLLESDEFNRDKLVSLYNLTFKEKEILNYLSNGYSDFEIGCKLMLSPVIVKDHEKKINNKFKSNGNADLIKLYNTICA
jgi:DNA-binding CsgD family transcriptional regulator